MGLVLCWAAVVVVVARMAGPVAVSRVAVAVVRVRGCLAWAVAVRAVAWPGWGSRAWAVPVAVVVAARCPVGWAVVAGSVPVPRRAGSGMAAVRARPGVMGVMAAAGGRGRSGGPLPLWPVRPGRPMPVPGTVPAPGWVVRAGGLMSVPAAVPGGSVTGRAVCGGPAAGCSGGA